MANIKSIIKLLVGVNWIKTIYFNFYYLPIKKAIHLPILIYKNTKLSKMKGVVLIDANIRMGMIRIGQYRVGTLDMKYHRTMWQCEGTVIF